MTKTLEISDESYERIKEQLKETEKVNIECYSDLIGKAWFFRTVTYHMVGKVTKIIGSFVQLENASWIPDSGRFMQFIKNGTTNEVEPVGTCFVNIDTVTDFFPWNNKLPKEQA